MAEPRSLGLNWLRRPYWEEHPCGLLPACSGATDLAMSSNALSPGPSSTSPSAEVLAVLPHLDTGVRGEQDRLQLLSEVEEYFTHGARVVAGQVVLDVGANVGAFAMLAAEKARGALALHCFEPAPKNIALLRKNLAARDVTKTAHIAALALVGPSDAGKTLPLYFFKRNSRDTTIDLAAKHRDFEQFFDALAARVAHTVSRLFGKIVGRWIGALIAWLPRNALGLKIADLAMGMERTECQTQTLADYCAQQGITAVDLLKIDVESAELSVLSGVGSMWPKVKQVVVEATDRDGRVEEVCQVLRAHGFEVATIVPTADSAHTGIPNRLIVTEPRH